MCCSCSYISLNIIISKTWNMRHNKSFTFSGASVWNSLPVNIQNASNIKQFKSLYLRWFRNSATYLYYAMIHIQQKIYNAYQKCEFNAIAILILYMYSWHLLLNHIAIVLWNCVCNTSLTLDLVFRPKYSFIAHAYFIQLVTNTCIHSFSGAFSLRFIQFLL